MLSPGNTWQWHFQLSQQGEGRGEGRVTGLEGVEPKGAAEHSVKHRTVSGDNELIIWPRMSVVLRLRKPSLVEWIQETGVKRLQCQSKL